MLNLKDEETDFGIEEPHNKLRGMRSLLQFNIRFHSMFDVQRSMLDVHI